MAFPPSPPLVSFMLAHPAGLDCQMKCNLIDSLRYLELHSKTSLCFLGGRVEGKTGTEVQELERTYHSPGLPFLLWNLAVGFLKQFPQTVPAL